MSAAETGIMPPPHQFYCDTDGLTRWSATIERVTLHPIFGGNKLLSVCLAAREPVSLILTPEQSAHLARLLAAPHPATHASRDGAPADSPHARTAA